jgi:hypothetical protein
MYLNATATIMGDMDSSFKYPSYALRQRPIIMAIPTGVLMKSELGNLQASKFGNKYSENKDYH